VNILTRESIQEQSSRTSLVSLIPDSKKGNNFQNNYNYIYNSSTSPATVANMLQVPVALLPSLR
jgi:hypothetical protein